MPIFMLPPALIQIRQKILAAINLDELNYIVEVEGSVE